MIEHLNLAAYFLRVPIETISSVGDPWHFGADPDPRICTSD
jgi:hypothetical protein